MRYIKHLILFALVAVALGVGLRVGSYAVDGIDFVEGNKIPTTLTADRTHSGANTFSGATTLSGAVSFTDAVTLGNASGDAITVTGTMTAAEAVTGTTGFSTSGYYRFGADPADAGAMRLSNADDLMWEASAAGTDINALTVDASEVVQIGSSGASGVTITPALTVTGGLVSPKASGHHTSTGTAPTASAGTIDTKSTDHAGRVTSVGATSTIITFAAAYTATPACVATASDEPVWIVGASTTGFTPTATGNIDDLSYACWEIE